ncbi:hypothetical protein NLG97_g1079 [Lecanicillium saksenae]|uniref:Uncharacterized protein n=1 Tax=Lecanicillium saksenae TaxID=468837 RepID=A0ACC1R7E7_9HYPO|nr:hypothetical protein NLG97_g1079 [Lecanicillium saksenae]
MREEAVVFAAWILVPLSMEVLVLEIRPALPLLSLVGGNKSSEYEMQQKTPNHSIFKNGSSASYQSSWKNALPGLFKNLYMVVTYAPITIPLFSGGWSAGWGAELENAPVNKCTKRTYQFRA